MSYNNKKNIYSSSINNRIKGPTTYRIQGPLDMNADTFHLPTIPCLIVCVPCVANCALPFGEQIISDHAPYSALDLARGE